MRFVSVRVPTRARAAGAVPGPPGRFLFNAPRPVGAGRAPARSLHTRQPAPFRRVPGSGAITRPFTQVGTDVGPDPAPRLPHRGHRPGYPSPGIYLPEGGTMSLHRNGWSWIGQRRPALEA